jgi:hypothetical protein
MPRFSIKRLFVSTGIVAIGLGALMLLLRARIPLLESPGAMAISVASTAVIGAGLLHSFRLAWPGALIGALAWIVFLAAIAAAVQI